jgi:glyoxylase-like metal-dependent hydrolase (beta-lactamase superfamily II)
VSPEPGATAIDLRYLGTRGGICCYADLAGGWLVDPGPEATRGTLLGALPPGWQPQRVLLTHVHFDHAGAVGGLLRAWSETEVWVHERGAAHLVDPSRLLASARRVWGDDLERLWGTALPVPEGALRVVRDGEAIDGWKVAYTPGHASHHVAYLDGWTGTVFAGDVAGVQIGDGPLLPPSPPPDIDRELWIESTERLERLEPRRLAIAHSGFVEDAGRHLAELREQLDRWSDAALRLDADGFADATRAAVAEQTSDPKVMEAYERANPPQMLWEGWARYWRKRGEPVAA